ncbi:peptidase S8/S53 domain-containing protein [Mycena galopus ATCC 62051]|nr:peptidase S8/S53 domain-containing protein [Mycena galopus ATCC 62051]
MTLTQSLVLFTVIIEAVIAAPRFASPAWTLNRRADPDALIPLKFSLTQSNLNNLETFLLDVSDPQSPNYGKHWSPARVKETFRPSAETINIVHAWLAHDAGIPIEKIRLSANGDILHLDLTIAEAETILQTEYYVYSAEDGIDLVWPTVHFGGLSRRSGVLSASSFGREGGAPKIPVGNIASLAESGCNVNTVGVVEFEGNTYMPSDLNLFFETYRPDQVGHTPTLISIEGGDPFEPDGDVGEPCLDMELMMGLLGSGQNLSLYQVGETSPAQMPADELLGALDASYCALPDVTGEDLTDCGDKLRTNVISISYHLSPDLIDPTISPAAQRACTEIGKLSLTGITFVASSGDGGVAYSQATECLVNGTLIPGNPTRSFVGQLPASCPFITAVGATSVAPGATTNQTEESTTIFPSGGGFSNNFPRPTWQDGAVQNYLDNFAPDYAASAFNRSGRAYPDVAANGWPLVIAEEGEFTLSGGTSTSAPIFASVIAAINDARIAAGKGPVGFINPALYSPALEAGALLADTEAVSAEENDLDLLAEVDVTGVAYVD